MLRGTEKSMSKILEIELDLKQKVYFKHEVCLKFNSKFKTL